MSASAQLPPASVQSVAGLGALARKQGWSVISTIYCNLSQAAAKTLTNHVSGSRGGCTVLINEMSPVSVPAIKFVVSNYYGNAVPHGELPPQNDFFFKAVAASHANTGYAIPARWQGDGKLARVGPKAVRVSDPVPFPVQANTVWDAVEHYCVTSGVQTVPTILTVGGGSSGYRPSGTDGALTEDASEQSRAAVTHTNSATVFAHQLVLGYTGANPTRTICGVGDSIMAGTGDCGAPHQGTGGWGHRIALGALGNNAQWPPASVAYAFSCFARAGDTLANFISGPGEYEARLNLISYFTDVISNFGTNDLGPSNSAAMKANYLTLAVLLASAGVAHITQATLLPRTTSTDGNKTLSGQSVTGNETTRTTTNSWLRDTSAAGWVAQASAAIAAAGYTNVKFHVFDAAAAIEVNSAGVLTLNGGYWPVSAGVADYSGTVTTGGTGVFTDTSMTAAANTHTGKVVRWLTGANANTTSGIYMNNASGLFTLSNAAIVVSVGDTYKVLPDESTIEGTHPYSYLHGKIAQSYVLPN